MSVRYKCPFLKSKINISADIISSTKSEANYNGNPSHIRTRKELSLKEKLEILKRYDGLPKMSQRSAAILKVSQPVLCKILKNRNFIENIMPKNENCIRKRARGGKEREIETSLKLRYVEVLKRNIPINGQIIREKAKELGKQVGKEFAATDGWFARWRKRENIVYNAIFRRKIKTEVESGFLENSTKDNEPCVNTSDPKTGLTITSHTYNCPKCTPGNHLISHSISPEVNLAEESKCDVGNEHAGEVFIKTESDYEYESKKRKPAATPPTNEEMLEALTVLSMGVKHRTSDLKLHYEYEHFINRLLVGLV